MTDAEIDAQYIAHCRRLIIAVKNAGSVKPKKFQLTKTAILKSERTTDEQQTILTPNQKALPAVEDE